MGKHAYLIMAHNELELLKVLLASIDDERNDIFIHVDKKAGSFDKKELADVVQKSGVYFTERLSVVWGDVSQIECEITLLRASVNGNYDYYHLLSGQDLPIKNQNYIHNFFDKNMGKEFVRFNSEKFNFQSRVRYYYLFGSKIGRSRSIKAQPLRIAEKISLSVQKLLGVNRIKNSPLQYQKGTNWFSITDDLAKYVVDHSDELLEKYKYTLCCDEVFLQTLVVNSPFASNLYHAKFDNDIHAIMRFIDWERGNPYVFRNDDIEELLQSDMLFARKFSLNVDNEIVETISNYVQNG